MENSYNISILSADGKIVGKLPTASAAEVSNLINKGFVVINNYTNTPIDITEVTSTIGVSECVIGE